MSFSMIQKQCSNMKRVRLTYIIAILSVFTFISCAGNEERDEAQKRVEFAKIVESRSTRDKLNDLYVGADGDIEALARVLQATPSSIERLRKGETEPTQNFEERLADASLYYFMNDQSFTKLCSILDNEYGWYDSILNFPSHYPWYFWGITIGLFLLTCCFGVQPVQAAGGFGMIIELLVFFVAWGASYIFTPETVEDKYINVINPIIETIL